MRQWFVFFILSVLFLASACHEGRVEKSNESFYLLEDITLLLNAEQVLEKFKQGSGVLQRTHSFNPGFTISHYWLLVQVDSASSSHQLQIGTPHINTIEFYEVRNNVPVRVLATGDHKPYSTRGIPALDFVLPLKEECNQYLVKIDKRNESLQLTFDVKAAAVFWDELNRETIIVGVLTGAILLMLLFGIYLTIITGEKIYIFYVFYIACGWLWVITNLGYGFKYVWPDNTWLASRVRIVAAMLSIAFGIQFISYYAGVARFLWQRVVLRVTNYLCWLMALLFLLPIQTVISNSFAYFLQGCVPIIVVVYILMILFILIQKSTENNKMAIFYLSAIGVWILFSMIQLLHYAGWIDVSGTILEKFGAAIGYVIEVIVLTFGLAYRFNSYRYDRIQTLIQMNLQQSHHTHMLIKAQENERRQLADQLHDVAGSLLSAAKLNLSSIRENHFLINAEAKTKVEHAEDAVTSIAEILRNMSHAISPVMLDKVGFKRSVEKIATIFNSAGKIAVELIIIGFEKEHTTRTEEYSILYGILYELMNNIAKHSQAKNALIQLIEHEDSIVMMVEDNGIGFDPNTIHQHESHGLTTIQSKVHYLNGSLAFDQAQPHGLILTIEIPKKKNVQ